jgi:HKD family nuclease
MSASTTTTTSYAQNRSLETTKLVLDSGASEHFTPNKEWLLNYEELSNKTIIVANSAKAAILGKGNIPLLYKG